MKDHCTWFPEYWYAWTSLFRWKRTYIGDCCKGHDEDCKTSDFFECLRSKRIIGGILVSLGGALGCWFKYKKV